MTSTCRGTAFYRSQCLGYLASIAVIISAVLLQLPTATLSADQSGSGNSGEGEGSSSGSGPPPAPGSVPLNFIFLSSNNPRLRTSGSIPAVDIALEMVNNSGILGKYLLQYTEALDSQVSGDVSLANKVAECKLFS